MIFIVMGLLLGYYFEANGIWNQDMMIFQRKGEANQLVLVWLAKQIQKLLVKLCFFKYDWTFGSCQCDWETSETAPKTCHLTYAIYEG